MNRKIVKVGERVLCAIFDTFMYTAEGLAKSFDRKEAYKIISGNFDFGIGRTGLSKCFYELERRGYIEKNSSDQQSFRFTDKAKLAIVDKIVSIQNDQGTIMFVSFDIPECLHRNRDLFRRSIKKMGFRQIQKSLWVCNKNVGNFIDISAKEYKVSDYIVYIASKSTNIDNYIAKILG